MGKVGLFDYVIPVGEHWDHVRRGDCRPSKKGLIGERFVCMEVMATTKIAKLVNRNGHPHFTHDCEHCRFLGVLNGEDLYVCQNTGEYTRRFGNEPADNGSLGTLAPAGTPYALAKILAIRGGTPSEYISV